MNYRPQWLPSGYVLDESDPDMLVLRRADGSDDGSFIAAFYSRGATREGILEVAQEDRRKADAPPEERTPMASSLGALGAQRQKILIH